MTPNPYNPPKVPVDDRTPEEFSWWAVWIGASAATGTAYMIGSWLSPLVQHWYYGHGVPADRLYETMLNTVAVNIAVLLYSAFAYGFGGYAAATLAPARPIRHAIFAAIISMVTGAVTYLGVFTSPLPLYAQVLGFIITIPCSIAGAYRYMRRSENPVKV